MESAKSIRIELIEPIGVGLGVFLMGVGLTIFIIVHHENQPIRYLIICAAMFLLTVFCEFICINQYIRVREVYKIMLVKKIMES